MISYEQAMRLHERSIADFGGGDGIRDNAGLLAALARPYATFGGEELYKDVYEQAAAIGESIIINHPFVDGNKRTGFALMIRILDEARVWLNVSTAEMYQFVIDLATGEKRFEKAVEWLRTHSSPKS